MSDTPLEEAQDMLARAQAIGARVREHEHVIVDMSTDDLEELRKGPRGLRRGRLRRDRSDQELGLCSRERVAAPQHPRAAAVDSSRP